jgi:AraC family ethanolamine operon transcriptional activator
MLRNKTVTACTGDLFASSHASGESVRESVISSWGASFSDADEQAACISSVYPQTYEQLGCGQFAGEMTTVDLGGVLVVRERVNRRLLQNGLITAVSLAWAWQKSHRYRTNGVEHDDDCMMFFAANEEFDILTDPSEMVAVSLSEQTLADWFGCPIDSIDPTLFRGPRKVPTDIANSLRCAIMTGLAIADQQGNMVPDELWRDSIRDELLQAVTTVAELPVSGDRHIRRCERTYERVVRAAREFALQNSGEELSLQDVYQHIGVSRRNLHYAFDAVMGISPGQYLRSLRLNAARRDIKRWNPADHSLADIAARWGFWHPSHFAADYKRRFGELPSDTAHRAAPGRASAPVEPSERT